MSYSQSLSQLIQDMGEIQRDGKADEHVRKIATAVGYVARCEEQDDNQIRQLRQQVEALSKRVKELEKALSVEVRQ